MNETDDRTLFPVEQHVYAGGMAGRGYSPEELTAYRLMTASLADNTPQRMQVAPLSGIPFSPNETGMADGMVYGDVPEDMAELAKGRWRLDDFGRPLHPHLEMFVEDKQIGLPLGRHSRRPYGEYVVVKVVLRQGDRMALKRAEPSDGRVPIVVAHGNAPDRPLWATSVAMPRGKLELASGVLTDYLPIAHRNGNRSVTPKAIDRAAWGVCFRELGVVANDRSVRVLSISRPVTPETTMHSWPVVYLVEVDCPLLEERPGAAVVEIDHPGDFRHRLNPLDRYLLSTYVKA